MADGEEAVEVTGRTVDEAVQKGLDSLHLRRDQVNIEIISDGARTMLGFRAGQVRVRLSSRPPQVTAPERPIQAPAQPVAAPAQAVEFAPGEQVSTGDEGAVGADLLREMLARMGIKADVEVAKAEGEEPIRLNIKGKNLGTLIGRRGETLSAMQFLTRLMVSHRLQRWANIVLDVDDYRIKREDTLKRVAVRIAEQAVQTGRVQELEPMPPSERRIIHLSLRDFDGVTTQSEGEGEARRVTIIPAKSKTA
jgi:spoIIIJ-associated protein